MSYTNEFNLTTTWQALGPAGRNVMAQLQSGGPVRLAVDTSTPGEDFGMDLSEAGLREIVIEGVETGDIIYGKVFGSGESATVAVIVSGVAP